MINAVISALVSIAFLLFLAYGLTQWLHFPVGSFGDWLTVAAIFLWLVVVVTVPWNIYFRAKEVLHEAEDSQEKGIRVDSRQVNFASVWVKRSLIIALGLHFLSALVLYLLAINAIGAIGYWGAIATLLLTLLRPVVRAYQYLNKRLSQIMEQVKYPREDIIALIYRIDKLEQNLLLAQRELDPTIPNSLVSKQNEWIEFARLEFAQLKTKLEDLRSQNQQEHLRLSLEAKEAVAQLSEDSQFLSHVREVIRFFKSA